MDWHLFGRDAALLRGYKCNPSSSLNLNSHFPEFPVLLVSILSSVSSVQFSSVSSDASPFFFLCLFSLIKNVRATSYLLI